MKLIKYGYKRIVTYTTRPKRKGEKQGVTYNFISKNDFEQKIKDNFFAEYKTYNTEFGVWYYGTSLEDLKNADDKSIIILTPQGYKNVKEKMIDKDITSIYLYASDITLKQRLEKRGDNQKEAERRLKCDEEDFKNFESEANLIVLNNYDDNIDDVVKEILNSIKERE